MPDSFGNPLPEDFSNSFSNDLSLGNLTQAGNNSFGVNSFSVPNVEGLVNTPQTGGNSFTDLFSGAFSNGQGGQGYLAPALGAISGAARTYLGFGQLKEGRRQNRINNQQWQAQFDIQKGEYDRRTSERDARVAANRAASAPTGG